MPDHVATSKPAKGAEPAGASAVVRHDHDAERASAPGVVLRATRPALKPPERASRAATARALVEAFDMIAYFLRRALHHLRLRQRS